MLLALNLEGEAIYWIEIPMESRLAGQNAVFSNFHLSGLYLNSNDNYLVVGNGFGYLTNY